MIEGFGGKLYINGQLVGYVKDWCVMSSPDQNFLETKDVPFFHELDVLPDEGRIILRLLSRIILLPKKITHTIYDFPDWLCRCVENNNLSIEIMIVFCRLYCRQSYIVNNTQQIKNYVLKRVKANEKLSKLFDQAALPSDTL